MTNLKVIAPIKQRDHLFHGGNAANAGKAASHPRMSNQAVQHLLRCAQVEPAPCRLANMVYGIELAI